jgi:hypothetical protein
VLTVAASFSLTAATISSTAHGFLFNLHQQQQADNDLLSFPSSIAHGFLFINSSRRHRSPLQPSSSAAPLHRKLFPCNCIFRLQPLKCKTAIVDFAM